MTWSATFGRSLVVYQLLAFSLRVRFDWNDRAQVVGEPYAPCPKPVDTPAVEIVLALTVTDVLGCNALLAVGWDESLLAFGGPPTRAREDDITNPVEFFTLGTIHWMGLYDTDQLLYEALPFLFDPRRSSKKVQLIRGVLAHLAELQHEAKVAYLAEHRRSPQRGEAPRCRRLLHRAESDRHRLGSRPVPKLGYDRLDLVGRRRRGGAGGMARPSSARSSLT